MSDLKIEEWSGADMPEAYEALADSPYALFFDSNRPSHPNNRWSFICWAPVETIETKNGVIFHDRKKIEATDFFTFLQSRLDNYNFNPQGHNIPFTGGAAGYFGYDLGRQLEDLPDQTIDDMKTPDACIGIYTNVLAFDHKNNKAWKIGGADLPPVKNRKTYTQDTLDWKTHKADKDYCRDIAKIIDYIHAGEVYQVNLSRRFEANLPEGFNAYGHYKNLRDINPAPFSAFMNFGDVTLVSCSPERFLSVTGSEVETRPIKGTLPSTQNADILIKSAKDRAENTMIVDLLRNDLSKVCDYHSVKVPELCMLETFAGVHHLVSTVKGILQEGKTATDLLRACFPGGSITGAPKIRAMEIIEELEETRRGPYCGAIGYISFNGRMDTNIVIRTLVYTGGKAYLQTGGGIVSDSIPEKELQESLDKAAKIFESFKNSARTENAA